MKIKKIIILIVLFLSVINITFGQENIQKNIQKNIQIKENNINKVLQIVNNYKEKIDKKAKEYNKNVINIDMGGYKFDMFVGDGGLKNNLLSVVNEIKHNPSFKNKVKDVWNNNVEYIFFLIKNPNQIKCKQMEEQIKKEEQLLNLNKVLYNEANIKLSLKYNMPVFIGCYYNSIFKTIKHDLDVIYKKYRYINIGLSINKTYFIKPQEEFSFLESIKKIKDKLVYGPAIVNGSYRQVKGGGLCGAATMFYQSIYKIKNAFDIIQRVPHSEYYWYYYGKIYGMDSTIYGPYIDLKFKNKGDTTVVMDGFINKTNNGKNVNYGFKMYKPYISEDQTYYTNGEIFNKKGKKCVKNFVYLEKNNQQIDEITSCYKILE